MRQLLFFLLGLAYLPGRPAGAAPLPPPPDSLRAALWAAAPGAPRAAVLLRIVAAFDTPDPDSAAMLGYAAEAVRQARQAGDSVLVGKALDAASNYYLTVQRFEPAARLAGQAEPLLRPAPALYRARNAYNLGWACLNLRQVPRALRYYQAAGRLFGQAHDLGGQAGVLQELGDLYRDQHRPDSAAANLFRAVGIYHRLGDARREAKALTNVASLYTERGQLAVSGRYCRQAYRLAATLADSSLLAVGLEGLGVNAQRADSPAVALRYLRQQQALVRHLHFYPNRSGLLANLASAYRTLHQPDSARAYYQAALALARRLHDPDWVLGRLLTNLATLAREQGQPTQAASWATQALALDQGQPSDAYTTDALTLLRGLALDRADYPAAYQLLLRETQAHDTLQARARTRQVEEVRASYELDQAEQQVQVLRQAQELANLRRQRELAGLGGGLLALAAATGWGLRRRQRRQHQRETALRTRLAADLHDDVGSLLTQISLESSWLTSSARTPEGLRPHLAHLADASRRAVQQLSDVVWGIDVRNDATRPLLERMRDHAHETLSVAGLEVDFVADDAVNAVELPLLTRQNLYLIYKEALHNVVKHAQARTVAVSMRHQDATLILRVQDDGRGYAGQGRPGGQGRANMQARAAACGGRVAYEPGHPGLAVVVVLPA